MSRWGSWTITFVGERPKVRDGDRVLCRTVDGEWDFETVARSEPRYDVEHALGGDCYLTVAVEWPRPGPPHKTINWPAESVRLAVATPTGDSET